MQRGVPAEERFWRFVDLDGPVSTHRPDLGACWIWTGGRNRKGYGQFGVNQTSVPAYRFAYETWRDPIPEGFQLDHLCRVRACVNPYHLEPVTQTENQLRGESFSAVNARKTHCIRGHELTPENSYGYHGRRQCKTCARERARRQHARKRKH